MIIKWKHLNVFSSPKGQWYGNEWRHSRRGRLIPPQSAGSNRIGRPTQTGRVRPSGGVWSRRIVLRLVRQNPSNPFKEEAKLLFKKLFIMPDENLLTGLISITNSQPVGTWRSGKAKSFTLSTLFIKESWVLGRPSAWVSFTLAIVVPSSGWLLFISWRLRVFNISKNMMDRCVNSFWRIFFFLFISCFFFFWQQQKKKVRMVKTCSRGLCPTAREPKN